MDEQTPQSEKKVLVGGKVSPRAERALKIIAPGLKKKTVSFALSQVLDLDPKALRLYRKALREAA